MEKGFKSLVARGVPEMPKNIVFLRLKLHIINQTELRDAPIGLMNSDC